MGKSKPASDLFGALTIYDEHRTEVLKFFNVLQWLTTKQDGLVLGTRHECCFHLGNMYADCCGMGVKCLKQALHLPIAITPEHKIVSVSKVQYMDVRTNLNPWGALQGLTKNPVDIVVEDASAHPFRTPERISVSRPHLP